MLRWTRKVQSFIWDPNFSSLGYLPRGEIVGSYGCSMFGFWGISILFSFCLPPDFPRYCRTVFYLRWVRRSCWEDITISRLGGPVSSGPVWCLEERRKWRGNRRCFFCAQVSRWLRHLTLSNCWTFNDRVVCYFSVVFLVWPRPLNHPGLSYNTNTRVLPAQTVC